MDDDWTIDTFFSESDMDFECKCEDLCKQCEALIAEAAEAPVAARAVGGETKAIPWAALLPIILQLLELLRKK